jgi:uncharacterized RDD family membrane protein YckC
MQAPQRIRLFDPHESARADTLAGAPLASFGQRAGAFLIDFFFVLITYSPVEALRQYFWLWLHHAQKIEIHVEFDFHSWGNVIWLVLYFGLFVWLTNGQTPGKRLLRIRIVSLAHSRITLWQAVERALGYGASFLEGGFGFVQFFMHRNRCCVHDRIAETIVVREPARVKPYNPS